MANTTGIKGKSVVEFTDEQIASSISRLDREIEAEETAGGPAGDLTKQRRILRALWRETIIRQFGRKADDDPSRKHIAVHAEAFYGVRLMDDEWVQAEAQRQIEKQAMYAEIQGW